MSDKLDNPQRWECENCGHAFYDNDGWSQWHCTECGKEMHKSEPEGYVPKDELRELVEKWRDMGAGNEFEEAIKRNRDRGRIRCADELEELIEE